MTAEMRAARLHKPGEPLRVDRIAAPEPGPRDGVNDALAEVKTRPGGLVNIVVNPDR